GSSFSTSGDNLTLNVALTFSGTFTGSKNVYMYARGKTTNSGWVTEGTWIPAPGPLTVVSLTPNSGTGLTRTFAMVFGDPNGLSDLSEVLFLFNTTLGAPSAFY